MKKIYFISRNKEKIKEVISLFENTNIEIIPYNIKIEEIQSSDVNAIIKDKALKAFSQIGRPVIVEHSGLLLEKLNYKLPNGLTQEFWDSLEADKFSQLFGDQKAKAFTIIGYIDGKKLHTFKGEIEGIIINEPRGCRAFHWDCVFIPNNYEETFAEMGTQKKNEISMRKQAFDLLLKHFEYE